MAGLYDRMISGPNRLSPHVMVAALQMYHGGVLTQAQAKSKMNDWLTAQDKNTLGAPALTDVDNIITEHDTKNTAQKAVYIEIIEGSTIMASEGERNETNWRADLNIT